MSATLDPSPYHDDHTANLQKVIQHEVQGRILQTEGQEMEPADGKALNLMEVLKPSLTEVDG